MLAPQLRNLRRLVGLRAIEVAGQVGAIAIAVYAMGMLLPTVILFMLTASLAKHSRTLTQNRYFNGHPDLIVRGRYANDQIKAGVEGVEIKTTRKKGGAVDFHGNAIDKLRAHPAHPPVLLRTACG